MKIIETVDGVMEEMRKDQPMPPHVMKTEGYSDLEFECGCGMSHGVNDPSVEKIASFRPIKILFKCKSHYTKVRIKGVFSQTCISEWTCQNKLLRSFVEEKNL